MKDIRNLVNRFFGDLSRKHDVENLYVQLSSFIQIYGLLPQGTLLKPLRGWAISPDALLHVAITFKAIKPAAVVEFGSGQSTIVLAALLKSQGAGKLLSIEHNANHARSLETQLKACGLSDWVDARTVRLVSLVEDPPSRTYDLTWLEHYSADLVLVDGPPASLGLLARYSPLKWAVDNVTSTGSVFLDDANRPEEEAIVNRVMRECSALQCEAIDCEKGL